MWCFQVLNDNRSRERSRYYRRRAFAYSVLAFILIDFIPNLLNAFKALDSPYEARSYAIAASPWLVFLWYGLKDGEGWSRGFIYSIFTSFRKQDYTIINNQTKINKNDSSKKFHNGGDDYQAKLSTNKSNFSSISNALGELSDDIKYNESYTLGQKQLETGQKESESDTLHLPPEDSSITLEAARVILKNAYQENYSDIHIEPKEDDFNIRVRKDGVLQKLMSITTKEGKLLTSCLKNMAAMDVAEKRASQDGKILLVDQDIKLEFRCSTVAERNGESMVLRLLKSESSVLDLDTLIKIKSVKDSFRKLIKSNNGIIVVSGPTGSGKSTTLAASLKEIDNGDVKIITIEDPIEFALGGDIVQAQVNRPKGQTFSNLLKTLMRHDPDVILIGETRDPETAISSMDAAETGHLVFTTLHSNSASSTLTRLLDMEVPKYKLNVSVRGILAQRLLRRVCTCCSEQIISKNHSLLTGINPNQRIKYATILSDDEIKTRTDVGTLCNQCKGIGYSGRIGIYELLIVNRQIQNAISSGETAHVIQDIAIHAQSMMTLRQYGIELIKAKYTTVSELERVCSEEQ